MALREKILSGIALDFSCSPLKLLKLHESLGMAHACK